MSSISRIEPVVLEGRYVRLEPLCADHFDGLHAAGGDERTFRWFSRSLCSESALRRFVDDALADQERGLALPFAIRTRHDGVIVGSTRFGAVALRHARAEVGWTWLSPSVHRTPVNTECKYLMLSHAFDTLGLNRIEFKTDALNMPSRAALRRIGAMEEGVFRHHMITDDGRVRDSVYFSIIRPEWPIIRGRLQHQLARPYSFRSSQQV